MTNGNLVWLSKLHENEIQFASFTESLNGKMHITIKSSIVYVVRVSVKKDSAHLLKDLIYRLKDCNLYKCRID